jgi:hypothetical protein
MNRDALLMEEVLDELKEKDAEEFGLLKSRFDALCSLRASAFLFPGVKEAQSLRGGVISKDNLIQSLCNFSPANRTLRIPTRIVAFRSCLVAKCHAFSLAAMTLPETSPLEERVRREVFSAVSALMAEEVYFSCLEDEEFPEDTKKVLADDLIALWELGSDPRETQNLKALEDLWAARGEAPPTFGTMDGASELFRLSLDLSPEWEEFLLYAGDSAHIKAALEEFLFGLPWEEIQELRAHLRETGRTAIGQNEAPAILGKEPMLLSLKTRDPRLIYDFYIDRKNNASFRKRSAAAGPWSTIEEMYLRYRLRKGIKGG